MFIYYKIDEQIHQLAADPEETVKSLKRRIDVPAEELLLYCRGRPLHDDERIKNCAEPNDTIDVSIGLPGGKVHGSLAGAGKVKGQTPKVEKQEKRKKKTARAKRRMQYNRRFVSTVTTLGGRKRGPNAQAT